MLDSKQKGSWYRKIKALVLTFNALRLLFLCFSSKTVCCPRELTAWGQFFGFSGRGHCGCPRSHTGTLWVSQCFTHYLCIDVLVFKGRSVVSPHWGEVMNGGHLFYMDLAVLSGPIWNRKKIASHIWKECSFCGSHNARSYISQSFSTSSEDPPNSCCVDEWLFPGCLQIGLGDGIETSKPLCIQ